MRKAQQNLNIRKKETPKKEQIQPKPAEDSLDLPGIVGSKIVLNEKPQNKKTAKDISDPDKFMREMMGKDYSILLGEEPEKPKANEMVNLNSFIPVLAHEEKAQQAAKSEDDKNLFTVVEENTINERAGNVSDNDIVDDSNSFASDDSGEESEELGEEVKRNRRTISDGYKDEERGVLVQDFDDDIETAFNTVPNLEEMKAKDEDAEVDKETLESKEARYQRMVKDLEKHKKELAGKIPLDIIEKFCEMTKENKSLVT